MNADALWRCLQYHSMQWATAVMVCLLTGGTLWYFYLLPAFSDTDVRYQQLQRLTRQTEIFLPEIEHTSGSAAPALLTQLPETALPMLAGWQQEPQDAPSRWILTFEAYYPALAGLLDTLTVQLTELNITRLSLHPVTGGPQTSPALLQMTLHLALPGAESRSVSETDLPDINKEEYDN
ncbi:hypothetical protein [Morganella psychrotolerans]|uniref:hypothetical protein n=1 Tax=Morganella psychrotolerans TaxID=368603 RepID=UPI0039B05455